MRVFEFIDHFGERGFYDLNAYDLHIKFQSLELLPDLQGELTRDDAPNLALFAWLYLTGKTLSSRKRPGHDTMPISAHVNVSGTNVVEWLTAAFQDLELAASINVMEYDANADEVRVYTTTTTDEVLLSQEALVFRGAALQGTAMTNRVSRLTAPFFFGMAAHLLGHIQPTYIQPADAAGEVKRPYIEAANIYY